MPAINKGTQLQRALQLVAAMRHQGLLPDGITYNTLVSACEKGALHRKPLKPWRQCCTKASCQTGSPTVLWSAPVRRVRSAESLLSQNPLISAYDQGKQLRPALNVCEAMLRDGVPLDVVSYGAVISACEKCKEMRRALNICDAMLRHGIKPNIVSYNAFINAK